MGYETEFTGAIEIQPPLSDAEIKALNDTIEAEDFGQPGMKEYKYSDCKWSIIKREHVGFKTETEIICEDGYNFYNAAEWMKYLIDNHLSDRKCNGTMEAFGSSSDDHWFLVVEDNNVSTAPAIVDMGNQKEVAI